MGGRWWKGVAGAGLGAGREDQDERWWKGMASFLSHVLSRALPSLAPPPPPPLLQPNLPQPLPLDTRSFISRPSAFTLSFTEGMRWSEGEGMRDDRGGGG